MRRSLAAMTVSLGLALISAACAGPGFEAEVIRLHALAPESDALAGRTVTFEPAREHLLEGDFGRYARIVGERLARFGLTPAGASSPDLVARLDYAVIPLAGEDAGGRPRHARRIDLALEHARSGRILWEGRALSVGPIADLDFVFPRLADSLLARFPGPAGEGEHLSLPLTDEGKAKNEDKQSEQRRDR